MAFRTVGVETESTLTIEFASGGGGMFAVDADATPVLTISYGGVPVFTVLDSSHPSTGVYVATWTPDTAGQYDLVWSFEVSSVAYEIEDTVFALDSSASAGTSGGFVTVSTTSEPFSANLVQGEFTYRSGADPSVYQFTIVYNAAGEIAVREIEDAYGQIMSPYTQIPKSVSNDIVGAMQQVENLLELTSAVNGSLSFTGESSKSVVFSTPLPNASYRVQITSDVFAPFRVSTKSTLGFTIESGSLITGTVDFDVFV